MSKNNYQKPSNTGKKQIIYGLHAVKAALLNDKRNHYELLITENHQKLADNYKSKIQKITLQELKTTISISQKEIDYDISNITFNKFLDYMINWILEYIT